MTMSDRDALAGVLRGHRDRDGHIIPPLVNAEDGRTWLMDPEEFAVDILAALAASGYVLVEAAELERLCAERDRSLHGRLVEAMQSPAMAEHLLRVFDLLRLATHPAEGGTHV